MKVEYYNEGFLLSRRDVNYLVNVDENSCRNDDENDA